MKPAFTPRGLLTLSILMLVAFAVLHFAGLRVHTSVLSSTLQAGTSWFAGRMLALVYVISYLLAVFVAPVFAIGATALWLWNRTDAK